MTLHCQQIMSPAGDVRIRFLPFLLFENCCMRWPLQCKNLWFDHRRNDHFTIKMKNRCVHRIQYYVVYVTLYSAISYRDFMLYSYNNDGVVKTKTILNDNFSAIEVYVFTYRRRASRQKHDVSFRNKNEQFIIIMITTDTFFGPKYVP